MGIAGQPKILILFAEITKVFDKLIYILRVIDKGHMYRVLRRAVVFMVDYPCTEIIAVKYINVFRQGREPAVPVILIFSVCSHLRRIRMRFLSPSQHRHLPCPLPQLIKNAGNCPRTVPCICFLVQIVVTRYFFAERAHSSHVSSSAGSSGIYLRNTRSMGSDQNSAVRHGITTMGTSRLVLHIHAAAAKTTITTVEGR